MNDRAPGAALLGLGIVVVVAGCQVAATDNGCQVARQLVLPDTTPLALIPDVQIERAGADALELNFYHVATDPRESGADVEDRLIDSVRRVKASIHIPVAVKLSPFFSSLANLALRLDAAGAEA